VNFKHKGQSLIQLILPVHDRDILHRVFLTLRDGASIAAIIMTQFQLSPLECLETASRADKELAKQILVYERATGKLVVELIPNYIRISLRLMYSNRVGRKTTGRKRIKALLEKMTARQGKAYSSSKSRKQIGPFIQFHNLNMDEALEPVSSFSNFNEFFYRKVG
jgi:hypothetical protein